MSTCGYDALVELVRDDDRERLVEQTLIRVLVVHVDATQERRLRRVCLREEHVQMR